MNFKYTWTLYDNQSNEEQLEIMEYVQGEIVKLLYLEALKDAAMDKWYAIKLGTRIVGKQHGETQYEMNLQFKECEEARKKRELEKIE